MATHQEPASIADLHEQIRALKEKWSQITSVGQGEKPGVALARFWSKDKLVPFIRSQNRQQSVKSIFLAGAGIAMGVALPPLGIAVGAGLVGLAGYGEKIRRTRWKLDQSTLVRDLDTMQSDFHELLDGAKSLMKNPMARQANPDLSTEVTRAIQDFMYDEMKVDAVEISTGKINGQSPNKHSDFTALSLARVAIQDISASGISSITPRKPLPTRSDLGVTRTLGETTAQPAPKRPESPGR